MYAYGQGVQQDRTSAVKYFKMAADQGNVTAQYNLGLMCASGRGVQDHTLAVKECELAADQKDAQAQYDIAVMHEHGQGMQQGDVLAMKYSKLAADQGHALAQLHVGVAYAHDEAGQQDCRMAVRYYKFAAKQGVPEVIMVLDSMFDTGTRVQVTGLTCNSDLNGATGTVTKTLYNGRSAVVLDGQTKPQFIRHSNLDLHVMYG